MSINDLTLWIQAGAAVAAVSAAIIALVVSALDRRNTREIALCDRQAARELQDKDRAEALRQSQLLFEQEALLRLLENARHGGSSDDQKRSDLGAEAGALIGFIGPDRLPLNWENRVAQTPEELRAFAADESNEAFLRNSVEVQLALWEVTAEIRQLLSK